MGSCRSEKRNNMGPPQKQVHICVSCIAATQQLTKPEALPKGVIQTLCESCPHADGTRLPTRKAGAEETIQTRGGKATYQGHKGGQRHICALVQAFCLQENTLPITLVNIHTTNNSITFQSRQTQMWFKCTFLILSTGYSLQRRLLYIVFP